MSEKLKKSSEKLRRRGKVEVVKVDNFSRVGKFDNTTIMTDTWKDGKIKRQNSPLIPVWVDNLPDVIQGMTKKKNDGASEKPVFEDRKKREKRKLVLERDRDVQ